MDVNEAMLKRRSIRKYTEEKISEEQIETLLHYAMSGPSACNKKPWEFYIVTNDNKLSELRSSTRFTNYNAPLMIVVCGNTKKSLFGNLSDYWIQDCSAAIENILLGVTAMGLGACWCGITPQVRPTKRVREILEVEEHIIPLGIVMIGHPDENPEPRDQYDSKKIHYVR